MTFLQRFSMLVVAVCLLSCHAAFAQSKKKNTRKSFDVAAAAANVNAALLRCDIDAADEILDLWDAELRRTKKPSDDYDRARDAKQLVENMLERVENVRLLQVTPMASSALFAADRIGLPLGGEAGDLYGCRWFDAYPQLAHDSLSTVHVPASGREVFWSGPYEGSYVIWHGGLLLDGTVDNPSPVFDISEFDDEDIIMTTPFLSPDGLTLYFSANISGSIGGLDIFRAVREGVGEAFDSPTNIGMPYNSVADDVFYVLDPVGGNGFFATDRAAVSSLESDNDSTSARWMVYTFVPNETRVNRDPEFEDPTLNLSEVSAIDDFLPSTLPEGYDPKTVLDYIKSLSDSMSDYDSDAFAVDADEDETFVIYIPALKRVYHSLDDFRNPDARMAMEAAIDAENELLGATSELDDLRRKYAAGDRSVSSGILELEKRISVLRRNVVSVRNNVIRLESNR